MRVERGFLLLNIMLVLVCALAHEIAAEQYAHLIGAAVLCAYVWRRAAGGRPVQLGDGVSTVICFVAFVVMILRSMAPTGGVGFGALDVRVPPIGEFLITFLCINLMRRKTPREYFWMYLVSVVLMGTTGMLMPGFAYAFFFILYTLIGLATVGAFHVWCEVQRHPEAAEQVSLRARSMFILAPMTLALMLPVAGVFVLLPRRAGAVPFTTQLLYLNVRPMTGFTTTVRLGRGGTIQDNPQRVMRVTLADPDTGESLHEDELLLRGTGLDAYVKTDRGWVWEASDRADSMFERLATDADLSSAYEESFPQFSAPGYRRIRCNVMLEPMATRLLFAPFAVEQASLPQRRRLFFNYLTHDFAYSSAVRNGQMQYSTISRIYPDAPPSGDAPDAAPESLAPFMGLPPELSLRVINLAREVAPDSTCPTDYLKARAILNYLSDSNRFAYTLDMRPTPGMEPVEDFLFNRRMGHCEYFASTMVVMLRAVGVPARLVNGFKMYEWNPIGEYYIVRQGHAHSWAEAYIADAGWRTYDPSVARDASTPQPALVRRWGSNLYDAAESLWVNYVLNFDTANQSAVYQQFNDIIETLRRLTVVAIMLAGGASLSLGYRQLMHVLWRAVQPLAPVLWILLAVVLCWLVLYLGLLIWRRWKRQLTAGGMSLLYMRMEQLLARHNLRRDPSQTPWEFHADLERAGWGNMAPVRLITETFCAVRYGQRSISRQEFHAAQTAMRELRRAKRRRHGTADERG